MQFRQSSFFPSSSSSSSSPPSRTNPTMLRNQNRLNQLYGNHQSNSHQKPWDIRLILGVLLGVWAIVLYFSHFSSTATGARKELRSSNVQSQRNKDFFINELHKEQVAKELCMVLPNTAEKDQCIRVVMSIDDREVARDYVKLRKKVDAIHETTTQSGGENNNQVQKQPVRPVLHKISKDQAEAICHHIPQKHKSKCIHDVMAMDDAGVANHYVHMLEIEEGEEDAAQDEDNEQDEDNDGEITPRQATILCSRSLDKPACIHDVLAMQDKDVVDAYGTIEEPKPPAPGDKPQTLPDAHHRVTYKDATDACKPIIFEDDKNQCIQDIMAMNDKEVAMHYVTLLREKEQNGEDDTNFKMHIKEAEMACDMLTKKTHKEECINDVMSTNDKKVALKFVHLLQDEEKKEEAQQNEAPALEDNPVENQVTPKDAAIVCVRAVDKQSCIHDVLAMQDVDVADSYEHHQAVVGNNPKKQNNNLPDHHHTISQDDATEACKPIQDPNDREMCIKDIMAMNDKQIALHYIHLLEDVEKAHETLAKMTQEEAQEMCRPIKMILLSNQEIDNQKRNQDIKNCIEDVLKVNNRHVAEHYVNLLIKEEEDRLGRINNKNNNNENNANANGSSTISQMEAEQICNHISFSNDQQEYKKETCVKDVMAMNGKEAAEHYVNLLLQQQQQQQPQQADAAAKDKPAAASTTTIRRPQAEELCQSIIDNKENCIQDVKTMDNPKAAESYVQLLLQQQQAKNRESKQ